MENENEVKRSRFIKWLASFIVKKRKMLFYTFVIITVLGIYFTKDILIDNSIELVFRRR
jgi:hypothetical protein